MKRIFSVLFFIILSLHQLNAQDFVELQVLKAHTNSVQNLRFSPDGTLLATCGLDRVIYIWDWEKGKALHKLVGHTDVISEVSFSNNGKILASASADGTVKIWNVKTGGLLNSITGIPYTFTDGTIYSGISFVSFSPNDKEVYFGGDSGFIQKCEIYNDASLQLFFSTNFTDGSHYSTITGGTVMPDGKSIVVTAGNYVASVKIPEGELIRSFKYTSADLNDVVAGPDKGQIATWTYNGHVEIWDYLSGIIIKEIAVTRNYNYSCVGISSDHKLICTGANGTTLNIWDWKSGTKVDTLNGHTAIIRSSRFHPTKKIVASASYDKTVRVWGPKSELERIQSIKDSIETSTQINESAVTTKVDLKPSITEADLVLGKSINLKNIQFAQGTTTLLPESDSEIENLASIMKKNPTVEIELGGHTDNIGVSSLNYRLSAERALVVKEKLMDLGIEDRRISTRAYGSSTPITDNKTEESRRKNRRVEVKIVKK